MFLKCWHRKLGHSLKVIEKAGMLASPPYFDQLTYD
jgi:hypothetical protein